MNIGPLRCGLTVMVALGLCGCASTPSPTVRTPVAPPPAAILDQAFLNEVARHAYRWYLDEGDLDRLAGAQDFPFWVRRLEVPLDAGDQSELAEIVMPLVGTAVKLKRCDYRIEELDLAVRSASFKITNVSKPDLPQHPPPAYHVVRQDYATLKADLHRSRDAAMFPEGALLERLKAALRAELKLSPEERVPGRQIVHLAPLSPVANEAIAYWENRNLLIRFASDIDLDDPRVWEHEALLVRTWDVREQMVVSLDEAAGSNAFLTRDQIGRALYNCVVLGRRLEVVNPEAAPTLAGP